MPAREVAKLTPLQLWDEIHYFLYVSHREALIWLITWRNFLVGLFRKGMVCLRGAGLLVGESGGEWKSTQGQVGGLVTRCWSPFQNWGVWPGIPELELLKLERNLSSVFPSSTWAYVILLQWANRSVILPFSFELRWTVTWHEVNHCKVGNSVVFSISTVVQAALLSRSKRFWLLQRGTLCPLNSYSPVLHSPQSLKNHSLAFCLYGFAYLGYVIQMESCHMWSFV